jgi:hypothetical protein
MMMLPSRHHSLEHVLYSNAPPYLSAAFEPPADLDGAVPSTAVSPSHVPSAVLPTSSDVVQ